MAVQVQSQPVSKTAAALQAFNQGERSRAYQLSLEATQFEANNSEAWFIRSAVALSVEEKILCLSHAQALAPSDAHVKEQMYHRVRDLLKQDPFLAYLEETEQLYRVRNNSELVLTIAKDRAIPEKFPPHWSAPIRSGFRLMKWTILGLIPAGLGTLIFAPLTAFRALGALNQAPSPSDRVRARVMLLSACLLFLIGLGLSYLFWIHVAG